MSFAVLSTCSAARVAGELATTMSSTPPREGPGGGWFQGNPPPTPTCLRPYQTPHAELLLNVLRRLHSALDASDTGTGKMYVACWLAKQLGLVPLVVAPLSTLAEWRAVASAFGIEVEAVNYEKVRGVRRRVVARRTCPTCKENGQPIFGPHRVRLSESKWGFEQLCGTGTRFVWRDNYSFIIFDEAQRCGGFKSLNSKAMIAAKRQAWYILALSATAADDPRQFKALGYVLGLFELHRFKWWLLAHGCTPGMFGGFDWHPDPEVQRDVMLKIHTSIFNGGHGARMRKEVIPGFPKSHIDVKLITDETGEAAEWAKTIRNAFDGHQLKKLTAARQAIELLKVPHFVDLAADYALTSRVIIFVNFKKTVATLRQKLKPRFGHVSVIDGSNTPLERLHTVGAFQNGFLPILICNNQAGGVGIGLHDPTGKVERTSLISPCYSSRDMKQVIGRPQRDGGAFSQQFFLYFANTLEERIAAAVRGGMENIDALNDATLNGVNL